MVLQDYPAPEVSEPIYRIGEKLRVIAKYHHLLLLKSSHADTHLLLNAYEEGSKGSVEKCLNKGPVVDSSLLLHGV